MKINGKILEIMDTQQVSDSFKKRTFILEYTENPQFPEYISFELIQDRCELIDGFQVAQEVTVSFNLKGRKWVSPAGETKYFNSLQAWRVEAADQEASTIPQPAKAITRSTKDSEEDELPF
jgi:hypothetical protein